MNILIISKSAEVSLNADITTPQNSSAVSLTVLRR